MKKIIKEVIPVILGVLIALLINNWNEDRKDKKYLNQIYNSIQEELKESSLDFKKNIPKQQRFADSLKAYINDETLSIIDIVKKADGIYAPRIKNNSWRAIANSRIELIEFKTLSTLSELDDSKKNLEYKQEKISDFLIENIKSTQPLKKEILILMVSEVISTEKYIQVKIDELIKESF